MKQVIKFFLFALVLSGCSDSSIYDVGGENSQTLILSAISEEKIYVQGQEEILTIAELELVAAIYLNDPGTENYVIQSGAGLELAKKIKAALIKVGVKSSHVAIAK